MSTQSQLGNTSFAIYNTSSIAPDQNSLYIFISGDTTNNTFIFSITNDTDSSIQLTGGDPVDSQQKNGASTFVFSFIPEIFTSDQAAKFAVSCVETSETWNIALPLSSSDTPEWMLAPANDLTLNVGDTRTFAITNVVCTTQSNSGNFYVNYYNVDGTSNDNGLPYQINILNLPVGKAQPLAINFTNVTHLMPGQVALYRASDNTGSQRYSEGSTIDVAITYDTYNIDHPINNGFTLSLTNTSNQKLTPTNSSPNNASVIISFLFDNDTSNNSVITTQSDGDNIEIAVHPEGKSQWGSAVHTPNFGSWTLDSLGDFVFGANETVDFIVSNLVVDPGFTPNMLSTVYIQVSNIQGYDDTVYTFQMQKETATPKITDFSVNPPTINYGDTVTMKWDTEEGYRATVDYTKRDGRKVVYDSQSTDPAYQIKLNELAWSPLLVDSPDAPSTKFTLSLFGNNSDPSKPSDTQTQSIEVNQPAPAITSFTASSQLTISGSTVTLTWKTTNADSVKLNGTTQQGTSSSQVINATETFTLEAIGYGDGGSVSTGLTVYAYQTYDALNVGAWGTNWQSLPLTLVNQSKSLIYDANANNNAIYQVDQGSLAVKPQQFTGNIMTLDASQTYLFVANTQANTITIYDVVSGNSLASTNIPGPPPYRMAVSPDNTKLFSLQQHGCTQVSVFNINLSQNPPTISYNKDITVGTSPRAMAFDTNGKAYISNADSSSISVINLSDLSTNTITLGTTEPESLLIYPGSDGNTYLYVACQGGNTVYCINISDTSYPQTSITVGGRPFTMMKRNNYIYVTNFGGNTVSVIDANTKSVVQTITVGNGPSATGLSPDGTLLFVSNYCDRTVSVVQTADNSVIGIIGLDQNNGNPVDISTYKVDSAQSYVFIAKENFPNRSSCYSTPSQTPSNLTMEVFSIYEK